MSRMAVYFITQSKAGNKIGIEGKWVRLPIGRVALERVLKQIGKNDECMECFITECKNEVFGKGNKLDNHKKIIELNNLAGRLRNLSNDDTDKLCAFIEAYNYSSSDDLIKILDCLKDYKLIQNVDESAYNTREYKGKRVFTTYGLLIKIV